MLPQDNILLLGLPTKSMPTGFRAAAILDPLPEEGQSAVPHAFAPACGPEKDGAGQT
jgi:hypothetical protein